MSDGVFALWRWQRLLEDWEVFASGLLTTLEVAVLAIIAGGDLMYRSNAWATNGTLSYGPSYVVTGVLYFILCFPLATWARRYEERLKSRTVPVAASSVSRPNQEVAIEC